MINSKQKKAQGTVTALITGVGGLIVLTVIVLIIVSTILDANLLGATPTATQTISNETGGYINMTPYILGETATTGNSSRSAFAITFAWNGTDASIAVGNYTVNTATGAVTNATDVTWTNVSYTYTFTYTSLDTTDDKRTADNLGANFTVGLGKVSSKIPTILLIAAVVLLFAVIVILIRQAGQMGIGSRSSL